MSHSSTLRPWDSSTVLAQLRAALRNPFIFLGLCALTAFAAALAFVWVMS